jgi:RNA polymerase sigma-70 factor (ECF subfamily)
MDEKLLIHSAVRGDLQAFNRLILDHQDIAFSLACYLLEDDSLSDQTVQQSVLSAHQSLPDFRGTSFRSWFLHIVMNACINGFRGRNNQLPEEAKPSAKAWNAIRSSLQHLPFEQRAILVLVDIHQLSYVEAAEVLGISNGDIKSRLAQARTRLSLLLPAMSGMPIEVCSLEEKAVFNKMG